MDNNGERDSASNAESWTPKVVSQGSYTAPEGEGVDRPPTRTGFIPEESLRREPPILDIQNDKENPHIPVPAEVHEHMPNPDRPIVISGKRLTTAGRSVRRAQKRRNLGIPDDSPIIGRRGFIGLVAGVAAGAALSKVVSPGEIHKDPPTESGSAETAPPPPPTPPSPETTNAETPSVTEKPAQPTKRGFFSKFFGNFAENAKDTLMNPDLDNLPKDKRPPGR